MIIESSEVLQRIWWILKENRIWKALPVIDEWLKIIILIQGRVVTEGLRIWTSRPYFLKKIQTKLSDVIAALKDIPVNMLEKSVGIILWVDISKNFQS